MVAASSVIFLSPSVDGRSALYFLLFIFIHIHSSAGAAGAVIFT